MPRPPAEPARSARDGRRHAACRSLRQHLSFLAASGAPLVRSHVCAACSLTSDPLARPRSSQPHFPPPSLDATAIQFDGEASLPQCAPALIAADVGPPSLAMFAHGVHAFSDEGELPESPNHQRRYRRGQSEHGIVYSNAGTRYFRRS